MTTSIDVFFQGDGVAGIALVAVDPHITVANLLGKLDRVGPADEGLLVYLEDAVEPLNFDSVLVELLPPTKDEDNLASPLRLHLTRCRSVEITVRFNGEDAKRQFPPSATVERVHQWATHQAFKLTPRDAAEHVLQIQGTSQRPDRDVHIGTLSGGAACAVAFDLVPRKRVEG